MRNHNKAMYCTVHHKNQTTDEELGMKSLAEFEHFKSQAHFQRIEPTGTGNNV
jgi:hypothetical protein